MKMSTGLAVPAAYWAEEPASTPGRARFRACIGGLHCSLCTGTIERALGKQPGVHHVAVSLTQEQALVEYDPARVRPELILATLGDIGYVVSDPRKVRPYEHEERELVREGQRLIVASGLSLIAIALIANLTSIVALLVPAIVVASFLGIIFYVLLPKGPALAGGAAAVLAALPVALFVLRAHNIGTAAIPYIVGALALAQVFAAAPHILKMAWNSLRRGILNQHVMLEVGAFAGIAGGLIGLLAHPPHYPTASFFAVSVLVANYHVFSEWLSLLVKTRSSQAVKKLLDLQPDTGVARARRNSERSGYRAGPNRRFGAGETRRTCPGRRTRRGRPFIRESIVGHGRADSSRKRRRRHGDRRVDQRYGHIADCGERCRRGEFSAASGAARRRCARTKARHSALSRSRTSRLYAGGTADRGARGDWLGTRNVSCDRTC